MSIVYSQRNTFLRLLSQLASQPGRGVDFPPRVETLLRGERAAGSRDRRLYRELFYTHQRHLPWMQGLEDEALVSLIATLAAETPATKPFRAAFALPALPAGLDKRALLPAWFEAECPRAFQEPLLSVLAQRSALWIRLQGGRPQDVLSEFDARGWGWRRSELLPSAVRILAEADVTKTDAFEQGLFEVQDLGSQLILEQVKPLSGTRWLDACAGAGGKTLQLACLLGPSGRVDAQDIRPLALEELKLRARRAGFIEGNEGRAGAVVRVVREPEGTYDGVLVDAPCSGTGTWRRSPHLKWCTTPEDIRRSAELQLKILSKQASVVRVGGRLVYATCSLCRTENEAVVAAFLASTSGFKSLSQQTLLPSAHDGDGFFVAVLERVS